MDFYRREECEHAVEASLANLQERERACDVTISEYIAENYRDKHLFYAVNHPRTFVIRELFRRVLRCMSISDDDIADPRMELDVSYIPIYPSVYRHLGLRFALPDFYWNRDLCSVPSSMLEYVSAYLHYCGRRILLGRTEKELLPYVAESLLLGERKAILRSSGKGRIELGGISASTCYDAGTRMLQVRGWYLPAYAYDEVRVFVDGCYLGNAQLGHVRNDVYAGFPQYGERRSGWALDRKIDLKLPCEVVAMCMKHGSAVRKDRKVLEE